MPKIKRSDLKGSYRWTAHPDDDPRVSGEPDSTLLNRSEGYEVLYFINKVCDKLDLSREIGLAIESILQGDVIKVRRQDSIFDHIKGIIPLLKKK